MKRSKILGIVVILSCIVIGAFIYNNQFNNPTGINKFEEKLKETGLVDEVGKELYEKGYLFSLNWDVLSEKKVNIVINLKQEEFGEDNKNEVEQIVNQFLIVNNVDPRLFKIDVAHYIKNENICKPG